MRHTHLPSLFVVLAVALAGCDQPSTPAPAGATVSAAQPSGARLSELTVYADGLAPDWTTDNSLGLTAVEQPDRVHDGQKALMAAVQDRSGALLFSRQPVKPGTGGSDAGLPVLPLKNYVAIRLWLNPGGQALAPDDLAIAIVGSDKQSYWSREEQSAPQQDVPYAGETRLSFLGVSALPANTWTLVEAWFNRLQFVPGTRYLTGFYLKSDQSAKQTFYVDDVALIAIPDATPPSVFQAASNDLNAVTLSFSEDLNPSLAEDVRHYQVKTRGDDPNYQTPQPPASAVYDPNTLTVRLELTQPLKPNASYTVQVEGIADLGAPPNTMSAAASLDFIATALVIGIDAGQDTHPIDPHIYGLSGAPQPYLEALRATYNNWGGNPNTRYNWELGNAWSAARDWEYRNGTYGYQGKAAHDDFISETLAAGADVRFTLPTLGWVAKNGDNNTCSFPTGDGKCSNLGGASCDKPADIADPNRTSVPSTVDSITRLVKHLIQEQKFKVLTFGLDNEPELWGQTHYDVHPTCTTYDEIRDKYIEYATAIKAIAPDVQLAGPNTCCWHFYWNSAAGLVDKLKHLNQDFLPWFLQEMRKHDEQTGVRTLDVLDLHFYPSGVYNDKVDPNMAKVRLNMTRSLWDTTYVDESWINQPVYLIPRMKQLIAENYPGTLFGISEWNWGAEQAMNGALAIADVLGIFGREGLDYATYWRYPPSESPGFFAFKIYTNYDGLGSRFADTSVHTASTNQDKVSAYGGIDSRTGRLHIMLLNKDPLNPAQPTLQIANIALKGTGTLFRYSQAQAKLITSEPFALSASGEIELPPYSITLLVLDAQ